MSDSDGDMAWMDDDDESYDFEYSGDESDDGENDLEIQIQNLYYTSKGNKESDPTEALNGFKQVVDIEEEKGDWGFKSLKQIVKLHFKRGEFKDMIESYKKMLTYIRSAVTRNYSEKCINSILDTVSTSDRMDILREFYETTLEALKEAQNERLWFKTNLKLGKLWFDKSEYGRLSKIVKELRKSTQNEDGTDDQKKGTQLLEVYALEIQMHTEMKNTKKLKDLYQKSLQIKSAIPHPKIMGLIRECGGKMHMHEREWSKAHTDFFESFKCYDEAGSPRRIQCLKYLVLANMLMNSKINPFDSTEAKPYKDDPEIVAMTSLIGAYLQNNINEFERILRDNQATIMNDQFVRAHIEDLLRNIRTQVLLNLLKPYTRVTLPFLEKQLHVEQSEVESLLVALILDGLIEGHIDQINKMLLLEQNTSTSRRHEDSQVWATRLHTLHQTVSSKIASPF